jgi:hypothetical protein
MDVDEPSTNEKQDPDKRPDTEDQKEHPAELAAP